MYLDFQKHQPLHTWIKVQDEKFKKFDITMESPTASAAYSLIASEPVAKVKVRVRLAPDAIKVDKAALFIPLVETLSMERIVSPSVNLPFSADSSLI
mmetsp:Transcript_255/g.642  ORF Transcript_255/g.642 Transcript_255/m.642 type:complete len:97 (+) Transcript_255:39-329(+)